MSTAMNFSAKSFKPRPPDKGAFPLDHFGAVTRLAAGPRSPSAPREPQPEPGSSAALAVCCRGVQRLQGALHAVPPRQRLRERRVPGARHGLPAVPHGQAGGGRGARGAAGARCACSDAAVPSSCSSARGLW